MKINRIPRVLTLTFLLTFTLMFNSVSRSYGQDNAAIQDSYSFKLGLTYEISNEKSKVNKIDMWYSENGYAGAAMPENGMFMIFDLETMKMITLMEAQKMAMVMDLKNLSQFIKKEDHASTTKVEKVAGTETFLGYVCQKYKISSDKTETYTWMTTELGTGYGEYAKNLAMLGGGSGQTGNTNMPDMKDLPNGVMLKMESTDLSTKKKTLMVATEVHKTIKTVGTSGFKVMTMPGK